MQIDMIMERKNRAGSRHNGNEHTHSKMHNSLVTCTPGGLKK